LFSGRRWIATNTKNIAQLQNITENNDNGMKEIKTYFNTGFHASDLIENGVLSISEATLSLLPPINLKWYDVEPTNSEDSVNKLIPEATINRRDANAMQCAICNNQTNRCQNTGQCADNGVCQCQLSATGALCQHPFTVRECVIDELINHGFNVSFDEDSIHGGAIQKLSMDTEFECDYETWVQRYVVALLLFATGIDSSYVKNVKECSFAGFGCNDNKVVKSVSLVSDNGFIPTETVLLTSLTYFKANGFTGQIPSELGLLKNLTYLYLADNSLSGEIPSELGLLQKLTYLDFYFNFLTGHIPSELGLLQNLTNLDLSFNSFSGQIPRELTLLTKLSSFVVGDLDFRNESTDLVHAEFEDYEYTYEPIDLDNAEFDDVF